MPRALSDLACENGHVEIVAHFLQLLNRQAEPQARSRGEALRRGSAFFLAQKGAHAKVVDLLNSANSENGPKVGPKAPPSPKLFF